MAWRWVVAFAIASLSCGASSEAPRTIPTPSATHAEPPPDPTTGTLVGRVVTTDGAPLTSFDVILAKDFDSPWQHHAVAATDGRFRISGIEPGTWDVMVQQAKSAKRVSARELTAGATTDLGDVVVRVGYSVQGTVTDADGRAIRAATVTITRNPMSDAARDVLYTTTTDSRGHYGFDGVAVDMFSAGHPHVLASTLDQAVSLPISVPSRDATIDLVARATGRLTGTVTGATRNVVLVIVQSMPDRRGGLYADLDATGSFHLGHVPEGDYSVWLMFRGHGGQAQAVTVVAGDEASVALVAAP